MLCGTTHSIEHMRHASSRRSRWLIPLSILLVGLVVVIAIAAALAPALLPAGDRMGGESQSVAAGVIFVVVVFVSRLGPHGAACWRDLRVIASRFLPVKAT